MDNNNNVRPFHSSKAWVTKVKCQSNIKHEPANEHPNTVGLTRARVGLMSPENAAKLHYNSQRQQLFGGIQQQNTQGEDHSNPGHEQQTVKNSGIMAPLLAALQTVRPEDYPGPPLLQRPQPQPQPAIHPLERRLPPRTTRAGFITPDQRAIFGPPVDPLERVYKVKPDGL